MDRRQRKSREAIFSAFISLLENKNFSNITVGEIIDRADVGRATFYAHFETKDFLLKELCEELFCHIFDAENSEENPHKHIFTCYDAVSPFLHLLRHIEKNDNAITTLLAGKNNELFWRYFKAELDKMVKSYLPMFESRRHEKIPDGFWEDHISATFTSSVRWWIEGGMKEPADTIYEYFRLVV